MFKRVFKGLVLTSFGVGAALGGAKPAQAICLPYITDSGQIVRICRQPAADASRDRFPGNLAPRHPVGSASDEQSSGAIRGSGR
jgi:hypothetical protein